MGWAFALHLCHEAVSCVAATAAGSLSCGLLRERSPAPALRPGAAALGVYVDNVYAIGGRAGDSGVCLRTFEDACGDASIQIHAEGDEEKRFEIIGN
eukprot:3521968-Lingulodinium_polyedra.AAC.1